MEDIIKNGDGSEILDPELTRVHKDTRFVIQRNGKVRFIFKKEYGRNILKDLADIGVKEDQIRYNKYGDILIQKII